MRQSVKSYKDYSEVKSVITTPLPLSFNLVCRDTNTIVLTNSKSISTKSSTQIKALIMDIAYISSNLIGHVSSSLRGTFMYEYDTEEHIVISCPIPPTIDIVNRLGSDVVLGVSISSYPVGFVCEKIRGRTGEFLVPY